MASPGPALSLQAKSSFTDTFNKWVQSIGIIVAAAWGGYTFVYKEITVPKTAPINISINLQLKKATTAKSSSPLLPIELRVSATNPSGRKVYLLPNKWSAWGYRSASIRAEPPVAFSGRTIKFINDQHGQYDERYSKSSPRSIIAAGSIFGDTWLSPNETVSRTMIFYVPQKKFDSVVAQIVLPSTEVAGGIEVEWGLDAKTGEITSIEYLVDKNGQRHLVQRNEKGHITDPEAKKVEFQMTTSSTEISLWE